MTETPPDIRPAWFAPIRRLQSAARAAQKENGIAIVTIKILVNSQGDPIQWTQPDVVLLQPWRDKDAILRLLGK